MTLNIWSEVLAALPPPKKQRHIVIMSNGSFGGIPRLLFDALAQQVTRT